MQPVQLSLLPDQVPALPVVLTAQLPDADVAAALMLLAGLITRTAAPAAPVTAQAGQEVTGSE